MLFNMKEEDNKVIIVDSADLKSTVISKDDYFLLKAFKTKICTDYKKFLALVVDEENYSLVTIDKNIEVFRGSFPTSNNRTDFFGFDIKILDEVIYGGYLLIQIGCNVWGKYDIEFPMVMTQVVAISLTSVQSSHICMYTSKALYICASEYEKSEQSRLCGGDIPYDCCISQDDVDNSNLSKLVVFGVDFGDVPNHVDLCQYIEYI